MYPVLTELENRGQVRRGYFVAGLGAAQFALAGAVDRLRAERTPVDELSGEVPTLVLAATDPAQPYGAVLAWPETRMRPARAAGAHVVLRHGALVAYVERGAKSIIAFTDRHEWWVHALVERKASGAVRRIELTKVDGQPVREHAAATALRAAGFVDSYRGMLLP